MRNLMKAVTFLLFAVLLVGCEVALADLDRQLEERPSVEVPVSEGSGEGEIVDDPLPTTPDPGTQLTDYGPVVIEELGLTLEIPQSTTARIEPLWEWAVSDVAEGRLGFNFMTFEPPMEPEAILPNHAQVLESEAVDLGWAEGRSYLLALYAPAGDGGEVESLQRHVVVVTEVAGEKQILDFYAIAPDAEGLAQLEGRLIHMSHVVAGPGIPGEEDAPSPSQTMTIPELNLTFVVPAGMEQELEFVWSADEVQDGLLGFNYVKFEPPMEPESVLPIPAQILNSEPANFPWGEGRWYTLEHYDQASESEGKETQAPVTSVQRHLLVRVEVGGERYFLDFYAGAPSAETLSALEPQLQEMVESVTLK